FGGTHGHGVASDPSPEQNATLGSPHVLSSAMRDEICVPHFVKLPPIHISGAHVDAPGTIAIVLMKPLDVVLVRSIQFAPLHIFRLLRPHAISAGRPTPRSTVCSALTPGFG